MTKQGPPKTDYSLSPDSELRFELESKDLKVSVQLKSGDAEIFGTELVKGNTYNFYTGAKVAIFTYYRCVITIIGTTDVIYVSKETPMVQYLNCHTALEQMRTKAVTDDKRGPIAMVCGPNDVGKSTLCRIFLNYAVRMNRRPLFADLDVGQGSISIPGTISTILIERPANIEEGFSVAAPLIYHFGHKSPGENNVLYKHMVSKMAEATLNSLTIKKKSKHSGIIINTCGWVKGDGYKHLVHVAQVFQVDIIFVLDQERLYNELLRDMPSFVKVVLLPKSGGVVERNSQFRAEARDFRIKEYFYGHKSPLYPFSFDVKWSEIKIYKIGAPPLPDSCMPIGMKGGNNKTKLVHVQPGPSLLHHILSITFVDNIKLDILGSNIAGFICVTGVDAERQVLTVLSPQPRPLPNVIFLLSDLQYMDNQ